MRQGGHESAVRAAAKAEASRVTTATTGSARRMMRVPNALVGTPTHSGRKSRNAKTPERDAAAGADPDNPSLTGSLERRRRRPSPGHGWHRHRRHPVLPNG